MPLGTPRHTWTSRSVGDVSAGAGPRPDVPGAPTPWTVLHQVHGADVVVVDRPGAGTGVEADAAVTATPGCTLAVRTADCAPLVLRGPGTVGIVHAGWRGLLAGVVHRAAEAMASVGVAPTSAVLGPCIRAGCYEFGGPELADLVDRYGDDLRARTLWGTPALDLPAAVAAACREVGVEDLHDEAPCTACDRRFYSHRARAERERFATLVWLDTSPGAAA